VLGKVQSDIYFGFKDLTVIKGWQMLTDLHMILYNASLEYLDKFILSIHQDFF
jgi:hypothetical protein